MKNIRIRFKSHFQTESRSFVKHWNDPLKGCFEFFLSRNSEVQLSRVRLCSCSNVRWKERACLGANSQNKQDSGARNKHWTCPGYKCWTLVSQLQLWPVLHKCRRHELSSPSHRTPGLVSLIFLSIKCYYLSFYYSTLSAAFAWLVFVN